MPAFQTMASKTDQDHTDAVGFRSTKSLKRSNDELKIEEVEGEDTIRDKQVQVNKQQEILIISALFEYCNRSSLSIRPI